MNEKIKEQILAIRNTGKTNMFDTSAVQWLAFDAGYFELVIFIQEHVADYVDFIINGDEEQKILILESELKKGENSVRTSDDWVSEEDVLAEFNVDV